YAVLTTTAAGATMYTDASVPAGSYTYRLTATNGAGDSASLTSTTTVTAPAGGISNLVVNDPLPANRRPPHCNRNKWSIKANFQVGASPFGDRTYTVESVGGSAILGGAWIQTAADSKNYTGNPLATFTVGGSFVYLLVDDRWNGGGTRP